MAVYTTELRSICETLAGRFEGAGYNEIEEILHLAAPKIFTLHFPLFDDSYRGVLQTKILRHYYTREIGLETVGLWKHFLNARMMEIMPFYNNLYTMQLKDLFSNVDYTTFNMASGAQNTITETIDKTTHASKQDGGSQTTTSSDNTTQTNADTSTTDESSNLFSDTPQGSLERLDAGEYLTDARKINSKVAGSTEGTSSGASKGETDISNTNTTYGQVDLAKNGTANVKNESEYLNHVIGKTGGETNLDIMLKFRESLFNIDMMIIKNLSDMFMNIY